MGYWDDPSAEVWDWPCEVCGENSDKDCVCPQCDVCGCIGDPQCYVVHGIQRSEIQKFFREINDREIIALNKSEAAYIKAAEKEWEEEMKTFKMFTKREDFI